LGSKSWEWALLNVNTPQLHHGQSFKLNMIEEKKVRNKTPPDTEVEKQAHSSFTTSEGIDLYSVNEQLESELL